MLEAIAESCAPKRLAGIDPSAGFLDFARWRLGPDRAELRQADARELPFATAEFDRVVSGLVLNFVPDPSRAAAEIKAVLPSSSCAFGFMPASMNALIAIKSRACAAAKKLFSSKL